jgi:hypothetical protein
VDLAAQSGNLVLIGGSLGEQRTIINRFVKLADPDGDGPRPALVAAITASSYLAQTEEEAADPDADNSVANGRYYVDEFQRFGAQAWPVPVDQADNYCSRAPS